MSSTPKQASHEPIGISGGSASPIVPRLGQTWRDFFHKSFLDPVFLGLAVLTVPLAMWGVLRTASNPNDHGSLTSFLLLCTPIIPIVWSVLQPLWNEGADVAIMVSLTRTALVPFFVALPATIAVAVTVHLPTVAAQIAATSDADGWRYFFGEQSGSLLVQSLVLTGIMGVALPMLAGLVLCVFVVLPVLAWWKPIGAAQSNMLLTETKADRAAAKVGIRALSILLMVAFAAPTLIIFGMEQAYAMSWTEAFANLPKFFAEQAYYYGDFMWALGILLIPVGVILILRILMVQRPDVETRAQYGVNSAEDHQAWLDSQRMGGGALGDQPEAGAQSRPK